MDHWDEVARSTVKRSASWYDWCDRHGFDEFSLWHEPHGRKFWSREHFKKALETMPAEHPDRWKYEVGALYAPFRFAGGAGDPRDFWLDLGPYFLFAVLPLALTPVFGPVIWLVPVAFGLVRIFQSIKRYRILST